jgi:hypothetical protein
MLTGTPAPKCTTAGGAARTGPSRILHKMAGTGSGVAAPGNRLTTAWTAGQGSSPGSWSMAAHSALPGLDLPLPQDQETFDEARAFVHTVPRPTNLPGGWEVARKDKGNVGSLREGQESWQASRG